MDNVFGKYVELIVGLEIENGLVQEPVPNM
jgi:hypothetical protein